MTSAPSDEPGSPSSPDPFGDTSMPIPVSQSTHTRTLSSLRSFSDPPTGSGQSTNPLGPTNAARRPPPNSSFASKSAFAGGGGLPADIQARLQAFQARRVPNPSVNGGLVTGGLQASGPIMSPIMSPTGSFGSPMMPGRPGRPARPQNWSSSPAIAGHSNSGSVGKPSLMERRKKVFQGALPGAGSPPPGDGHLGAGNLTNGVNGGVNGGLMGDGKGSLFDKYSEYVDAKTGSLKFAGKAVLHSKGVDFSSGSSFSISLDEVDIIEELGKGNYGTVYKVVHRKPIVSKIGEVVLPGKLNSPVSAGSSPTIGSPPNGAIKSFTTASREGAGGTNVEMAMKEIRLELDENKFAQIIMELDVLHRCVSPFIIDFYGAFFQEGAVYICMEYMDGGSIDKLYRDGVPEGVLRKITYSTVMGLKTLKDDHNIIHRDVKPTNILVNSRGEIKLCDFGVSGNLVASKAKTNIGCQSYMAPERIATGGVQALGGTATGTYSVQSDIWSLGLSILECAMGCYPYPPETYNNIFSQLSAIVDGEPPDLPEEGFTPQARDFVRSCLKKVPGMRPAYAMLLRHPWLADLGQPPTISEEEELTSEASLVPSLIGKGDKEVRDWVLGAIEKQKFRVSSHSKGPGFEKPALHAAPLDVVIAPVKDGKTPMVETIVAMAEKVVELKVNE